MLNRDQILATIDALYAGRMRGEMDVIADGLAPGATFELYGADRALGVPPGPVDAREAIGALVDLFQFQAMERLTTIIEGNRALFRWRINFTTRGCNPAVTEICDIWEFGDDGKALSLTQFADTAYIAALVA